MTPNRSQEWESLARQASTELDPQKLADLVNRLSRILGEREEASNQQRRHGNEPKSFRA
jgi:hypothetical protein